MRRPDRTGIHSLRAFAAAAALAMLAPAWAPAAVPDKAPPFNDRETATLNGRLLVATPGMPDPRFAGTVVLIAISGKTSLTQPPCMRTTPWSGL